MIRLSPRLNTVASLVRENVRLADVGTDHGYIPVFLVQSGKIKSAVAGDIGVMPLKSAENTINFYGLSDSIKTVLSDGLTEFLSSETEDIVIAGMGGELIVDILSRAEWVKNEKIHLVLQPMTHSEDVRKYLLMNGFFIDKEICVSEEEKTYIVMSAFFSGEKRIFDEFYCYFGNCGDYQEAVKYRKRQLDRLEKKLKGAGCSGDAESAEAIIKLINKYKEKYIYE